MNFNSNEKKIILKMSHNSIGMKKINKTYLEIQKLVSYI